MEKPKLEKEPPNPQTIKPKITEMEKPKEEKPIQNSQTIMPKIMEMEKPKEEKPAQTIKPKTTEIENPKMEKPTHNSQSIKPEEMGQKLDQPKTGKHVVWDCESSLYDSFELKSFERQLDSAIAGRTLSMPHLSDHHKLQQPQPSHQKPPAKKPSKISRSLQKFIRSVFRSKQSNNSIYNNNKNLSKSSSWFRVEKGSREGVYYVYDTSGELTTILEVQEAVGDFDGLSPDLKSFVRRTASDRFATASLGISCA